ncbi:nucleoside phosphatase family-domain-containing protein [Mycena rosella]|uniref:Nucleoside phosphatase family-domain-containing protein n=1 Tax=Mycena rosella TaxID=1033263 RepID=A0AAD7GWU1_MYCRO|nr:nucleoside phosphatase family-domain-containing protein [Mycena rosella]
MPPQSDPWLTGRHFGIVIDAGSSGSRLQIYSWKDPRTITVEKGSDLSKSLPKVEKGTREGEEWMTKVEPGISSYAHEPELVSGHLRPLLDHARDLVPPSLHSTTPLFLLATAGMRLLPGDQQASVLQHACNFLTRHSHFNIEGPSAAGPCGSSVRIITGEEEGLFGWIAVNYLMDGFLGAQTTYGFLDMGGASTQIAFEPQAAHVDDQMELIDVRLRLLGGEEIHHRVFVTTWLGYGTNQARERYVGKAVTEHEQTRVEGGDDVVHDPCLPTDLELDEQPVHLGASSEHAKKPHRLVGTGSFEQCMQKTAPLLNKTAPCPDTPCLMNGVHVPAIDFSVSHFIGVSEYWYSSEHVFGLGGPYDFVQYERAASKFCSRPWAGIVQEHEEARAKQHLLGGDGEVEKDGEVVEIGNWSDNVELSRLEMQCFKAAWIANVLHEGIGMPRLVDPGGNNTTDGEKVAQQAENKGLGRPTFQSVDTVDDIAISWTLGKMVLEASKEVPPLTKTVRPLVDPLDEPDNNNSSIKLIRPPFLDFSAIDDRLESHLPSALTRTSLGFSPVMFLFYCVLISMVLLLCYPLRRRLRGLCLRTLRDRKGLLEEGKGASGGLSSRPPSPSGRGWARRAFPFLRAVPQSGSNSPTFATFTAPPRSPVRSYSVPAFGSTTASSRSPSPAPGFMELEEGGGNGNGNGLSSRSRNASQKNLSVMVPRSRVPSVTDHHDHY